MKMLRMVGASQVDAIRSRITPVIEAWLRSWCHSADSSEMQIDIGRAGDCPVSARMEAESCWRMKLVRGDILLAVAAEGEWRRLVFGCLAADLPQDEVAEVLVARARTALLNAIAQALACEPGDIGSADVRDAHAYGSPFVLARLAFNQVVMDVLVDSRIVDDLLGAAAEHMAMLEPRGDAVDDSNCRLRVTLPLARISVEKLQSLKVGDVLIGEAGLATRFQLGLDDGQVIAQGYLGRQNGDRAFLLDSK
ncbi:MAG: putative flagellar motor switch protein FliM-like protein [Microvirga sp.]|jgi:hypothetical protein|nr:putative flagellar motor switch protein FliM-like protein [Microvirga sp.]